MPKSKEQFEQIRNERIDIILRCAKDLFALKGYEAVNFDEVTKLAKCSHGLIYHYFKNKEELYEAVLNKIVYPECRKMFEGIECDKSPKELISNILDKVLGILSSTDDDSIKTLYLLLNVHLQKGLSVVKKNEQGRTHLYALVEGIISKGIKEKQFKEYDSNELTISLLSLLKGLSFTRIHIGHKRFNCPHKEVIMGILIKEE